MDPLAIMKKYAPAGSPAFEILREHGSMVRDKALAIAAGLQHLAPDLVFLKEAAMLHDIGIVMVDEQSLGCYGELPYICHGYLGRQLLEAEGYPRHALVCERHIGAGITVAEIEAQGLPLPRRDMQPTTLEERIICYADKFFSKRPGRLAHEKSVAEVREDLRRFGTRTVGAFEALHVFLGNTPSPRRVRRRGQ